ncbi:hypothetical protein QTP70_012932 [Hemibagrus guttatus]|uniref:Reverse transcriptase domain-containing protein n=1 Tax=Hemibagrus guttatus TaxID=175788 RepID=A0AAE0UHV8_9TELE|nr:hypothetical protein QTP70_012932 [Hemibagrus guttatus]
MEKFRYGQRELHCVFVDLEKAYDRVSREELWYCMRKSGVAEKYVRVVQDMYERSRAVVRCAVGTTEEFKVVVGLHQGSALSPFLFAIVMDQLSQEEKSFIAACSVEGLLIIRVIFNNTSAFTPERSRIPAHSVERVLLIRVLYNDTSAFTLERSRISAHSVERGFFIRVIFNDTNSSTQERSCICAHSVESVSLIRIIFNNTSAFTQERSRITAHSVERALLIRIIFNNTSASTQERSCICAHSVEKVLLTRATLDVTGASTQEKSRITAHNVERVLFKRLNFGYISVSTQERSRITAHSVEKVSLTRVISNNTTIFTQERSRIAAQRVERVLFKRVLFNNTSSFTQERRHITVHNVTRVSLTQETLNDTSYGQCQILLKNEIRIFKKLVSRRKHEVLQNFLDFGPLGNSPVLLLLSPGKTPLTLSVVQEWLNKRNTTTVAKFLDTGKRDSNDLLGCPHYPLQGLAIQHCVIPEPDGDAAAQDALDGPSVEGGQDGRWKMSLSQPSQEVKTLLDFLGDGAGVERSSEVLCQVNTEEFGALDNLHLLKMLFPIRTD